MAVKRANTYIPTGSTPSIESTRTVKDASSYTVPTQVEKPITKEPTQDMRVPYLSRGAVEGTVYEPKKNFFSTKTVGKDLLKGLLSISPYQTGKRAVQSIKKIGDFGKKIPEIPKQIGSFLRGETKQELSPELESQLAERPEVITPKEQLKSDFELITSGKLFKGLFDKDVAKLSKPQVGLSQVIKQKKEYKETTTPQEKYLDLLKQSKEQPFRTGVAEGVSLLSPDFITKKSKSDMVQEFGETPFSIAQKTSPVAYMGGNVFGNVAKYGALYSTVGTAIGSKLASKDAFAKATPLVKELLIEGIKDLAISTPLSISEGITSGLKGKELADYIIKQMVVDLGTNAGIYGLSKIGKSITKVADSVKNSPEVIKVAEDSAKAIETKVDVPTTKTSAQKIVSAEKPKTSFKQKLDNLYTATIDDTFALGKVSDKSRMKALNNKKVGGTVDFVLKDKMVDLDGNVIGKGLQEITDSVPKKQLDAFYELVYHKHNIDRVAQGKPVFADFSAEESALKVANIESKYPNLKESASDLVEFNKQLGDEWLVKSGLLSKADYAKMRDMYPNYVNTKRQLDAFKNKNLGKKGFVDTGSGVKSATGGSADIIDPVQNTMNHTNQTIRTARKNQVGQSVLEAVRKNPEALKPMAEVVETPQTLVKEINTALDNNSWSDIIEIANRDAGKAFSSDPSKNIVTVLDQGVPVQLKINDESLYNVLTQMNTIPIGKAEKLAKKTTGLFKQAITQKNPFFAVRNIARDIPTAYVFGSEQNPIKFGRDLISAANDIKKGSPTYLRYKAVGGLGSNFFSSDKVIKSAQELLNQENKIRKGLMKPLDVIDTFNNVTETIPRYAEFKRVLNSTGDVDKALLASGEATVNFSRGGKAIKSLDSYVPYLNAGIQGVDRIARAFIKNPFKTTASGLIGITAPTIGFYLLNKDNPNYKALDNRTKDTYFLIPNTTKGKDEQGNYKEFIKIPKSRELGVIFGSLFERSFRKIAGETDAFKEFGEIAKTNFAPTNPFESNIFGPAFINLPRNKDFAGRTIVPPGLETRSPELQYDEKTSEIGKLVGQLAKVSPKQVDYLINAYTGIIGDLLIPATTKGGSPGKAITRQFTANPLYNNQAISDFYDFKKEVERLVADRNLLENIPSKVLTREEKVKSNFTKASRDIGDYYDAINRIEYSDMPRIEKDLRIGEIRKKIIDIATSINKWYRDYNNK